MFRWRILEHLGTIFIVFFVFFGLVFWAGSTSNAGYCSAVRV